MRKPKDHGVHERSCRRSTTNDPAVRRAVALAIGRVGADGAADALVNGLETTTARTDVPERRPTSAASSASASRASNAMLALAESGDDKDTEQAVEAFPTFRTQAAGSTRCRRC